MNFPCSLQRTFWPAFILLAAALVLFELVPLDLWIQDRLYRPQPEGWLIDSHEPVLRLLLYTAPKRLLLLFALGIAVLCFSPQRFRTRFLPTDRLRREWLVVLATLATGPLLISTLKSVTHVFCPYELTRYGGREEYKPVFERYTAVDRPSRYGRGFPAGHASGGFALLSLAGLGASRRMRVAGIAIGLTAGGLMGGYQVLKGAHFVSHNIVTALLCWMVFLGWRQALVVGARRRVTEPAAAKIHAGADPAV